VRPKTVVIDASSRLKSYLPPYDRALVDFSDILCAAIRDFFRIALFLSAGARRLFPVMTSAPVLEREDFYRFANQLPSAADLPLLSYHPLGTCRMGRDPKTSVVGLEHQTHDEQRLFVVDGSTVAGTIEVNPQLTIMALATRAADRIADVLG
jgi:choline dehydrogenase-like flavoprotein